MLVSKYVFMCFITFLVAFMIFELSAIHGCSADLDAKENRVVGEVVAVG